MASSRPYIGGSQNNSFLELTFGYNGFGRLSGDETGSVGGGGGGTGTGMWGATGWNRMFNDEIGSQISWLLPTALILLVAGLVATRKLGRTSVRRSSMLVWGGSLVTTLVVFSYMAGIFHQYYTIALAPYMAAVIGIGAGSLWEKRGEIWASITLAAAVVAMRRLGLRPPQPHPRLLALAEVAGPPRLPGRCARPDLRREDRPPTRPRGSRLEHRGRPGGPGGVHHVDGQLGAHRLHPDGRSGSASMMGGGPGGGGGRGGFGGGNRTGGTGTMPGQQGGGTTQNQGGGFPGGGTGTMPGGGTGTAPGGGTGTTPGGGGTTQNQGGGFGGGQTGDGGMGGGGVGGLLNGATVTSAAKKLLQTDASKYTWVAASIGSQNAASYQLATGDPVMAIGGFNGTDPSPTLAQFQKYVADGKIHYFISGGTGMGGSSTGSSSQITSWVEKNYKKVTVGSATFYDLTQKTSS